MMGGYLYCQVMRTSSSMNRYSRPDEAFPNLHLFLLLIFYFCLLSVFQCFPSFLAPFLPVPSFFFTSPLSLQLFWLISLLLWIIQTHHCDVSSCQSSPCINRPFSLLTFWPLRYTCSSCDVPGTWYCACQLSAAAVQHIIYVEDLGMRHIWIDKWKLEPQPNPITTNKVTHIRTQCNNK